MTVTGYALSEPRAGASQRGRSRGCSRTSAGSRSSCCCRPWCCSCLFIAYPFVKGVELSVTDTKVGVPGSFVGLHNFAMLANDSIFRDAVWNTFVYTVVTTVFKLALGLWLALLLNRHFKGKAITRAFILLPFIIPTVLSTFAWKWMFDPTFSVINWSLYRLGLIHGRINWLGDPDLAMTLGHHRQRLARRAVLRDQPAGRTADDQSRTARGGGDRRRAAVAALLARDLAAAAAGDHGGGAVLGDPDLLPTSSSSTC